MSVLSNKTPTLGLFVDRKDAPINGVARLSADLTINGTTKFPDFRYYGGMANAGFWGPGGYGEELVDLGSGGTLNDGSPCLGRLDDSFNPAGTRYFQDANTSGGQIGTGDIVYEMVYKLKSEIAVPCGTRHSAGSVGWNSLSWSDVTIRFTGEDSGGATSIISAVLTDECWYHILIFINRDEGSTNGSQIYVNGVSSGTGVDFSARSGTWVAAQPLTIGAAGDGGVKSSSRIAYVALWLQDAWHQAGAAGPTEWAAIALERFQKLSGIYPARAKGTATPVAARTGRAFDGHLDKVENDGTRKLYRVGAEWLRMCQRTDSSGKEIKGYLSETSVANSFLWSNTFDNTASSGNWINTNVTVATAGNSPNGSADAQQISEDGTNGNHWVYQVRSLTATNKYILSVWVKKGLRNWLDVTAYETVSTVTHDSYFNLDTGALGTTTNNLTARGIEDWGNGWYRCWIGWTQTGTENTNCVITVGESDGDQIFQGLTQISLYYFGSQLEIGSYPTSYIPTTTAARTRIADKLEYKGDDGNLGGTGSDKKGTLECDVLLENYDNTTELTLLAISDGGIGGDLIELAVGTDDTADLFITAEMGLAQKAEASGDCTNNAKTLIKATWKTKESILSKDGVPGSTNNGASVPDNLDRINAGSDRSQGQQPNGLISNIFFWERINKIVK